MADHKIQNIHSSPTRSENEMTATVRTATRVRQKIIPYLPPPVAVAIKQIDTQLEPLVGPEASITLMGSLLAALLVWKLLTLILGQTSSTSGAIQDDDEDDAIVEYNDVSYDGTIVFCGPTFAGKSTIFYSLVYPSSPIFQTVSSIKPNTGFGSLNGKTWRYLDTPGHWSPQKVVSTVLTTSSAVDRIIVVVDATQPVSRAVDYLYELLMMTTTPTGGGKIVVVACHKSDAPKAKNVRRVKLQVRNELERLGKLDPSPATKSTDWDDVLSTRVGFVATSVDTNNRLDELRSYLETGNLPKS